MKQADKMIVREFYERCGMCQGLARIDNEKGEEVDCPYCKHGARFLNKMVEYPIKLIDEGPK